MFFIKFPSDIFPFSPTDEYITSSTSITKYSCLKSWIYPLSPSIGVFVVPSLLIVFLAYSVPFVWDLGRFTFSLNSVVPVVESSTDRRLGRNVYISHQSGINAALPIASTAVGSSSKERLQTMSQAVLKDFGGAGCERSRALLFEKCSCSFDLSYRSL